MIALCVWSNIATEDSDLILGSVSLGLVQMIEPSPCSHWAHDVVATLNQRHWRWFNVATTSCPQWVHIALCEWENIEYTSPCAHYDNPANTRHWAAGVVLMLGQRRRRWPNIKTPSAQLHRLVFAGNVARGVSPMSGLWPSLIAWLQVSPAHSRPMNGVEHCLYTASMTNSQPNRDSNSVYTCEFRNQNCARAIQSVE